MRDVAIRGRKSRAMNRKLLTGFWASRVVIAGALASLSGASVLAQKNPKQPKIVFEKNAATPSGIMTSAFGQSCKATGAAKKSYGRVAHVS